MPERGEVLSKIGVVVIGRNEGDRLKQCLASLRGRVATMVYVDSGSSDASVAVARAAGADVVELDPRVPFTAARSRNEGFRRLRELAPQLVCVQFVDGDCELAGGWLEEAGAFLEARERAAVVCGRLRERFPQHSIYNLLCDIEWDTPVGEARNCGGVAMMRISAFESVHGFRADLVAGEEPELCVRLRGAQWSIWRIDAEMGLHDAAISRFGQWWTRSLRGGYACAQGADLHGAPPERQNIRASRSTWFWGLGAPLAILLLASWWGGWALLLLAIYPLQIIRLAMRGARSARENWWYAGSLVLGKFPQMLGQLKFLAHRWLGGQSRLFEYK